MKFEGAIISEGDVTFAVITVKPDVLNNSHQSSELIYSFQSQIFQGMAVILMSKDSRGRPSYYGRMGIVKFMSKVPLRAVEWKQFDVPQ